MDSEDQHVRPAVLYHYTDVHGLLGILEHKLLWLTHHSFLNDSNEIQYGKTLMKQVVPQMRDLIPAASFEEWIENFDVREERVKDQTYLVCFSEHGDQLSQWRAYADDGLGFAIGFRFSSLERLAGELGWCFGPDRVIYDRNKQLELMREAINDGFASEGDEVIEFWDGLLDQHAVTFKDAAFSEECEWRMTSIFVDKPGHVNDEFPCPTPQFRSTKYGIAPYVELAFDATAIVEIVIGPRSAMREKHWVLRQLLHRNQIGHDVSLVNSIATYR